MKLKLSMHFFLHIAAANILLRETSVVHAFLLHIAAASTKKTLSCPRISFPVFCEIHKYFCMQETALNAVNLNAMINIDLVESLFEVPGMICK